MTFSLYHSNFGKHWKFSVLSILLGKILGGGFCHKKLSFFGKNGWDRCKMALHENDISLLSRYCKNCNSNNCFFFLLFSRFRFADLAKINSQQADGFLRNNGLKYTPVCIHKHANSMIVL